MRKCAFIYCCFIVILSACKPNEDFGPQSDENANGTVNGALAGKILIGCEGNFQNSNASISVYDPIKQELSGSVFFETNNRELGDVLQSMTLMGDTIVIVLNNSGEVIFCRASDLSFLGSVIGLTSPRYALSVGNELWVSDLFSSSIQVLDPKSLRLKSSIEMKGRTEQMGRYLKTVLVADLDNREVIEIEYPVWARTALVQLDFVPRFLGTYDSLLIVAGEKGTLSQPMDQTGLLIYNLKERKEILRKDFSAVFANGSLDMENGYLALLLGEEVVTIDLLTSEEQQFKHHARRAYGIGLNPANNEVYVFDAKDFISNGWVFRYDFVGKLIDSVDVQGTIPQAFLSLF